MVNYFDDDDDIKTDSIADDKKTDSPAVGTLDKGEIDADLSKIFGASEKSEKPAETDTQANMPASAPISEDSSSDGNSFPKSSNSIFEPTSDKKPIFEPISDKNSFSTPKPKMTVFEPDKNMAKSVSTGSLSATQQKLKDKKEGFAKQISELQEKMKKVDEMIGKIESLKNEEAEILRSAEELA